jgi:hypothetical protein
MKSVLIIIAGLFFFRSGSQLNSPTDSISKIQAYIIHFAKTHKNWTQDDNSIRVINTVFADSLSFFYQRETNVFDHFPLRLESLADTGSGKRLISLESIGQFADGKEIRAHIYANAKIIPFNKLAIGHSYYLRGKISKADVHNNIGYNKSDNTCDIGILYMELNSIEYAVGR